MRSDSDVLFQQLKYAQRYLQQKYNFPVTITAEEARRYFQRKYNPEQELAEMFQGINANNFRAIRKYFEPDKVALEELAEIAQKALQDPGSPLNRMRTIHQVGEEIKEENILIGAIPTEVEIQQIVSQSPNMKDALQFLSDELPFEQLAEPLKTKVGSLEKILDSVSVDSILLLWFLLALTRAVWLIESRELEALSEFGDNVLSLLLVLYLKAHKEN